jgi:hypothetical protein
VSRVQRWTVDPESGCWLWVGVVNAAGYGQSGRGYAHRVNYEDTVGPVPEGLELDHLCRVRHCVNPAHLEPVTHAENMRRSVLARTHCRKGHPYEGDNLMSVSTRPNARICRTCRHERDRAPAITFDRTCSGCTADFTTTDPRRRYCTADCRQHTNYELRMQRMAARRAA